MAGRNKFARLTVLVLLLTSFWSTAVAAMQIDLLIMNSFFCSSRVSSEKSRVSAGSAGIQQ